MPVEEDPADDGRARSDGRPRDHERARDEEQPRDDGSTTDGIEGDAHETESDAHETEGDAHETEGDAHETESDAHETEGDAHETEGDAHETEGDAHEVYDASAESYADTNHGVAARAEYEWPMVRTLLPALGGQQVLDAGTGSGYYAARLAECGADVVGVDASAAMVEVARERHGDVAAFERTDLREPLPFADGRFDVVVCQLTLEHVRDWDPVMAEFARVLGDDGTLVASTDHPFSTYFVVEHEPPDIGSADADAADYYAVEYYERNWGSDEQPHMVPFYRRPLREVLRPLFDAGFVVEDLREPAPETDHELLGYFDDETPRFVGLRARVG